MQYTTTKVTVHCCGNTNRISLEVRLVNDNFASANKSKNIKDIPEKDLEQNSKDVGMTNEEFEYEGFFSTAIRH